MKLDEKDGRDVLKPNNLGIPHPPRFDRRDSFCSFGRMDGWTEKSQSKFTTQARLERANARERDRPNRPWFVSCFSQQAAAVVGKTRKRRQIANNGNGSPPHTHKNTHTHRQRDTDRH